jgi:hypothetical protein
MANCSIPSSSRASGPISTRSSRRLRKQNSQLTPSALTIFCSDFSFESEIRSRADEIGEPEGKAAIGSRQQAERPASFDRQFVIWRVKGAWWPSRSSKPLSSRLTGRGRFDSYPLRVSSGVGFRPMDRQGWRCHVSYEGR